MAEPARKAVAAYIACREEEEDRERKVLALKKGLEETKGLPAVHRMGPEGLLRNSFCISSKHFKENPSKILLCSLVWKANEERE